MVEASRREGTRLEVGVTVAGVLLMVGAAVAASRYTPSWLEPDHGAHRSASGLQAMWGLEVVGLAVVVAGLVLTGRELRRMPAPPVRTRCPHGRRSRPVRSWVRPCARGRGGSCWSGRSCPSRRSRRGCACSGWRTPPR